MNIVKGREEAKKIKQIKQTQSVVRRHLAGTWPLMKALKSITSNGRPDKNNIKRQNVLKEKILKN